MAQRISVRGPFLGIEGRDSFQTPQHSQLLVNVDLSDGSKRPRKGFSQLNSGDLAYDSAIRCITSQAGNDYVVRVGVPSPSVPGGDYHPQVVVTDLNGNIINDSEGSPAYPIDLTSTYGEPANRYFRCSMLEAFLPSAVPGILIFTEAACYVFEPDVDDATVRQIDTRKQPTGDGLQVLDGFNYYWDSMPRGPSVHKSDGQYWMGGFKNGGPGASLAGQIDTESDLPAGVLLEGSSSVQLVPWMSWHSDPNDPAGIWAPNFLTFDPGESYQGGAEIGEQHFLFTDKSIYSRTGRAGAGLAVRRVYKGNGCVAPHAIQSADGKIFYIATDGVYGFTGGAPAKLTRGLDWLWTGENPEPFVPTSMIPVLQRLGWPWKVDKDRLNLATSAHLEDYKQVWFNVPLTGGYKWACLVLDYNRETPVWTIYCRISMQPFFAGHHFFKGKHYFTSGEWFGVYGDSHDSDNTSQDTYIPVLEMGPKLFTGNQKLIVAHDIRFEVQAAGKVSAYSEAPQWVLYGSTAQFDAEDEGSANSNRQETSGDLRLHPRDGADGRTANDYFLNDGTWNGSVWGSKGWFMSRAQIEPVTDEWVRVCWFDNPTSADRSPKVSMRGYELSFDLGVGRR